MIEMVSPALRSTYITSFLLSFSLLVHLTSGLINLCGDDCGFTVLSAVTSCETVPFIAYSSCNGLQVVISS